MVSPSQPDSSFPLNPSSPLVNRRKLKEKKKKRQVDNHSSRSSEVETWASTAAVAGHRNSDVKSSIEAVAGRQISGVDSSRSNETHASIAAVAGLRISGIDSSRSKETLFFYLFLSPQSSVLSPHSIDSSLRVANSAIGISKLSYLSVSKMVRPKDKFWEHIEQRGLGHFTCNYCGLNYSGSVSQVKAHFACQSGHDVQICIQVPEHIQADALAEFNLSRSAKKRRSDSLESGMGSTSSTPSMPQVRSTHQPTMVEMAAKQDKKSLDMLVTDFFVNNNISFNVIQTNSFIDMLRGACAYGTSYVVSNSNLWTSLILGKKIEIMQYVSKIKATWGITGWTIMSDSWTVIKNRSWINVIAYSPGDSGSKFCFRGDMLPEKWRHIYKTNYATHGINLLLKDIHKRVKWSLIVVENELRLFVASFEWRVFQFNRAEMSMRTVGIIQSDTFWEGAKEVVAFMEPLVRILRLVDSDGSTAGYLYEATERAKETLRKFVENDGGKYLAIMDSFQFRSEKNIIHHVDVFGALLNSSIMFGGRLDIDGTKFMNTQ
ncbi:uncharacterized protein LOC122089533 [Macadamia integrifolia]|uniref:uncharacterized protein LOC122089533 n=1 Tax=Macadamia integrifolia TaxID=60698 RepID=UPI001C4EFCCA|nr:uncharacterized protein LOC122089533 [Macadamia integrifolia]